MSKYIKLSINKNKSKLIEFLNNHDYFLFDCDGNQSISTIN
jgi:hypothetical protein